VLVSCSCRDPHFPPPIPPKNGCYWPFTTSGNDSSAGCGLLSCTAARCFVPLRPFRKNQPRAGITLKPGDPFRKLLGADWNKTHWFGTAAERDAALAEMARKHEYSRPGDKPALKFDKVEKLHESRGL
jgi:hypothetical protein